jgi:hypothetical protein
VWAKGSVEKARVTKPTRACTSGRANTRSDCRSSASWSGVASGLDCAQADVAKAALNISAAARRGIMKGSPGSGQPRSAMPRAAA